MFRKATASNPNGSCVEVDLDTPGVVLVRDTKDKGKGPALRFTDVEWSAFLKGMDAGPDCEFRPIWLVE